MVRFHAYCVKNKKLKTRHRHRHNVNIWTFMFHKKSGSKSFQNPFLGCPVNFEGLNFFCLFIYLLSSFRYLQWNELEYIVLSGIPLTHKVFLLWSQHKKSIWKCRWKTSKSIPGMLTLSTPSKILPESACKFKQKVPKIQKIWIYLSLFIPKYRTKINFQNFCHLCNWDSKFFPSKSNHLALEIIPTLFKLPCG